jgi:Uma2 family endonuclease
VLRGRHRAVEGSRHSRDSAVTRAVRQARRPDAKIRGEESNVEIEGLKHKLDYDDLQDTPDDNLRYEILDGRLYVTPSPRPRHQRVSKRLQRQLEAYFETRELGEVFDAPVDVILSFHDVVVPDLVVVTVPTQVTERAIEGSPALLVEILSPSTASRDRKVKGERYAKLRVPHYWIVDPVRHSLECYRLGKTIYKHLFTAKGSAHVEHPDFPGLTIDLGALWR